MKKDKLYTLVLSAQKGDQKALSDLFNTFYNDVYYFALKILKNEDLACDITQETFIEIINTIGNLREPAAFVTWMKQITYHQCTRYFKKSKDVLVEEDEDGNSVFDTLAEERAEFIPDEALDQEDFRKTILDIIDTLSEEQRAAVMLYYYDEMTTHNIANVLGLPEGTVKSRLIYARKAIKRSVEAYEKKNGVRLHSVAVFPLMAWLLAGSQETLPAAALPSVVGGINAVTGASITISASSAVATATSAASATGFLAAITSIPVIAKVVTGIAVLAAVAGVAQNSISSFLSRQDPTGPIIASQITMTAPSIGVTDSTVPESVPFTTAPTEPIPTEPTPAEPTPTEPEETEPEDPPEIAIPVSEAGGTIEEGCTYVMADGTVLNAGESMPMTISVGDKYITPEYTYMYGNEQDPDYAWYPSYIDGWGVGVNSRTRTAYAEPLSKINGTDLKSMAYTYYNCENLITAPDIPAGVADMDSAFAFCTSLQTAPVIREGVTSLRSAFFKCEKLTEAPVLPEGLVNMDSTFAYCTALQSAPVIPSTVTDMMDAFSYCEKLTNAPVLPESVQDLDGTFEYCTSLRTAPVIPASVDSMFDTFYGCTALSGIVEINADVELFDRCFGFTHEDIILVGTCPKRQELAATATNGNVIAPEISGIWAEGYQWHFDWTSRALYISGEGVLPDVTPLPPSHLSPYIENLHIGSGLTEAYLYGFSSFEKLETVYIPDTLQYIDSPFEYIACIPSLKRFVVDADNAQYCSGEDGVLYNKDMTVVERVPCGFTGDYTVPDSVERLQPGNSIYQCNGLTNIYIGANVMDLDNVGNWEYFSCENLEGIWVDEQNQYFFSDSYGALYTKDMTSFLRLPMAFQGAYVIADGVTSIGYCAFDSCKQLTSVRIPEGVTEIREYAFFECDSLTELIFPSTLEELNGRRVFDGCDLLTKYYFIGSADWLQNDVFAARMFDEFKGSVYYRMYDSSWTEDLFARYPDITWVALPEPTPNW